jgi:hypothetical protein
MPTAESSKRMYGFIAICLVTGRRVRQKKNGAIKSWRTSKEEPHQVLKCRGDIELRFPEMVVVRSGSKSVTLAARQLEPKFSP